MLHNQVLTLSGYRVLMVNGSMTPDERDQAVKDFQLADGPYIMFISDVGAQGLNLQRASIMIFIVSGIVQRVQGLERLLFLTPNGRSPIRIHFLTREPKINYWGYSLFTCSGAPFLCTAYVTRTPSCEHNSYYQLLNDISCRPCNCLLINHFHFARIIPGLRPRLSRLLEGFSGEDKPSR
jgi:hypothetical protein